MHYKYDSVSGRLAGTNFQQAYQPQGVTPVKSVHVPEFQYGPNFHLPKDNVAGSKGNSGPKPEAFLRKVQLFQKNDGVLVHLKAGTPDKILFGLTVTLTVIGLAGCFKFYYESSVPKK